MTKLKHLVSALFILTGCIYASGQGFGLRYIGVDTDSVFLQEKLKLQFRFPNSTEAGTYIHALPDLLRSKGYISASVDKVLYDSVSAEVTLFLGNRYSWAGIRTAAADAEILEAVRWNQQMTSARTDFNTLGKLQLKLLDYLEEHGHPFGKVYLDSLDLENEEVKAVLVIDRGPIYMIDSLRIFGDVQVKNEFIQRYLGIANGSLYNKKRLENITRKLSELSYLQEERPSDITLLASGSILNIYLKPKRSSQVNALVGVLPNSTGDGENKKLLLTVDANILLRNALGSGETMGLVWQQLQKSSPRLNILFDQPYAFHSPFGLNFAFDMYKRDSSFLNMLMNLGTSYRLEEKQTTTVFLQRRQSFARVNEQVLLQTRRLPQEADVRSLNLGLGYSFLNTDFRFNPRKGTDFGITATAGTKKIRKNNQVLELDDPSDPAFKFESLYDTVKLKAYQFRVVTNLSHFIPLGGQSTLRLGMQGGIYQSANYFRNELFQIGGFRTLRGFDEESQFVSKYAIGTLEYRLRLDLNSYFFAFGDGGWGKHILETKKDHVYFGTGIGLSLETRAGILNLAWALGRRDDAKFNLRQSKFHIGLASYF